MIADKEQRIQYFDVAKGIGMVAIVWGHFLSPYLRNEVYSFHVPIFFCISGFFLSETKPLKEYVKNKVRQLLVPYMLTGATMIVVSFVKILVSGKGGEAALSGAWVRLCAFLYGSGLPLDTTFFSVRDTGPIWFLLALFWGLLITKCLIGSRFAVVGVTASVFLGMYLTRFGWLPFSIQAGMVASGYIYLGFVGRKLLGRASMLVQIMIACISVGMWWLYLMTAKETVLCCVNIYPQGMWDACGSLCGVMSVIYISKWIISRIPILNKILVFWGKHTLLFMCFHTVDTVLFTWGFIVDRMPWKMLHIILLLFVCKLALYSILIWLWDFLKTAGNKKRTSD